MVRWSCLVVVVLLRLNTVVKSACMAVLLVYLILEIWMFTPRAEYECKYQFGVIELRRKYLEYYFVKTKDEVDGCIAHILEHVLPHVEAIHRGSVDRTLTIVVDGGAPYFNAVAQFLRRDGAVLKMITRETPEQTSFIERVRGTIATTARCMLIDSGLGELFWAETNRFPTFVYNNIWNCVLCVSTQGHPWAQGAS